jgi:hypothetical protein
VGELLRDDSAERDTEDVDGSVAERVEEPLCRPCDTAHPPRPRVRRGVSDAGSVVADRLDAARVEFALERVGELQAGTKAGDDQQRPAAAGDRGAHSYAVDVDEPNVRRRHRHR